MKILIHTIILFFVLTNQGIAQEKHQFSETDTLSIVFYNVENLFDPQDDFGDGDNEFTQKGIRRWSSKRFQYKINKISQVLMAANHWKFPDIIGIAEIENRNVLSELQSNTILRKGHFKLLHKESADHRGIDVGMLYNANKLFIIDSGFYAVEVSKNVYSRDIGYACFKYNTDTLHVFVCHWPSRYGGTLVSNAKRIVASNIVWGKYNEIINKNSNSKILIMGDFNDEPDNQSVENLIKCSQNKGGGALTNLMDDNYKLGTIKFQNQWYLFDQFIISNNLLNDSNGLFLTGKAEICFLPFLMVKDEKFLGVKPFRTYSGYKYIGGYSDHLPIRIKFLYN